MLIIMQMRSVHVFVSGVARRVVGGVSEIKKHLLIILLRAGASKIQTPGCLKNLYNVM